MGLFCLEVSGLVSLPGQASHLGDDIFCWKSCDISDFRENTGAVDRADTPDGLKGIRKGLKLLFDGFIHLFEGFSQGPESLQDGCQDQGQWKKRGLALIGRILSLLFGEPARSSLDP